MSKDKESPATLDTVKERMSHRKSKMSVTPVTPSPATQLRRLLEKKYGSLIAAWQGSLDQGNRGAVDFSSFRVTCKGLGFHGAIEAAFEA